MLQARPANGRTAQAGEESYDSLWEDIGEQVEPLPDLPFTPAQSGRHRTRTVDTPMSWEASYHNLPLFSGRFDGAREDASVHPVPHRCGGGRGVDREPFHQTYQTMLRGAKDHLDFGEQFPYAPDQAKAQLKEVGFAETNPLHDTITTSGAEPALPTVAPLMTRQEAEIGVDVTVEVIDRPL
jgi:ABC-type transport system substrate-binding protein